MTLRQHKVAHSCLTYVQLGLEQFFILLESRFICLSQEYSKWWHLYWNSHCKLSVKMYSNELGWKWNNMSSAWSVDIIDVNLVISLQPNQCIVISLRTRACVVTGYSLYVFYPLQKDTLFCLSLMVNQELSLIISYQQIKASILVLTGAKSVFWKFLRILWANTIWLLPCFICAGDIQVAYFCFCKILRSECREKIQNHQILHYELS